MPDSSWRKDKLKTAELGYGGRWQKARLVFLAKHPLCVMCERDNRVTAATVVDHRIPHKGDQTLFWDRSNWQPLCASHHSREKQLEETSGRVVARIGDDGFPIDPRPSDKANGKP